MKEDSREKLAHPDQPVGRDGEGVFRFKENRIVRWMLDQGRMGLRFDLSMVSACGFSSEDLMQFAQLLGYSVSGFCELYYVTNEAADRACAQVDRLEAEDSGD